MKRLFHEEHDTNDALFDDHSHLVLDESTETEQQKQLQSERDPTNVSIGVQIVDLCKSYDNRKNVVDHLTLNLYLGQVTAFLGHNGAGKV
jgi:ABC-type transport system involved in cytochrome bd biosynthesis fused ATPase/permease subunit